MNKPNILITNDDGIFSSGIFALWEVVNPISNVFVIAPKNQQSAMSHALTLSKPLRAERVKRVDEFKGWSVSGTPTDCVKIGLKNFVEAMPDLIISGITFKRFFNPILTQSVGVPETLQPLNSFTLLIRSTLKGFDKVNA